MITLHMHDWLQFVRSALVASAAFTSAAHCQNNLPARLPGPDGGAGFGDAFGGVGDATRDGTEDVLIGDRRYEVDGENLSRWTLIKGGTGRILWQWVGVAKEDHNLANADYVGDLNGDHFGDFVLGDAAQNSRDTGQIIALSGKDGAVLWTKTGLSDFDQAGRDVCGFIDINGDHVPDPVVVMRYAFDGRVEVLSGSDGATLLSVSSIFPRRVANAGDVDGDLIADFLIGGWRNSSTFASATIISGRDGHQIRRLTTDSEMVMFGYALDGNVDVTGDGVPDQIVGDYYFNVVYLFDGATGNEVRSYAKPEWIDRHDFGVNVRFADMNADGMPDINLIGGNNAAGPFSCITFNVETGRVMFVANGYEYNVTPPLGNETAFIDFNRDGRLDVLNGRFAADGSPFVEIDSTGDIGLVVGRPVALEPTVVRIPGTDRVLSHETITTVATGADPMQTVYFVGGYSGRTTTYVPQLDLTLDLGQPFELLGRAIADADGVCWIELRPPGVQPPRDAFVQAVQVQHQGRPARKSNLEWINIGH